MAIEDDLARLGIEGAEARFYLAALEMGQAPVGQIAQRAGVSRTNGYDILARLARRGLLSQVVRGTRKRQVVAAEDPARLGRMLDEQQRALTGLLPELRTLYSRSTVRPRVRFYEGLEGIKTVLNDTLACRSRQLLGILSMGDLFNVPGRRYMEDYVRRRIRAGVSLKVLRSRVKDVGNIWPTRAADLRELRYTPAPLVFTMTTYIYDDKVSIISSRRENFGMMIESPEFAELQRNLFMVLWQASDPQR
jgi:sugar-specific transcriptional regulator TrmB